MKKKAILLMIIILVSGCTVVRINTKSIDNIVDIILSKNNTLYNQIGKGYKYYVPRGVSYIDSTEYNDTLYSDGNYYYLYVDVVGYYYNKNMPYTESGTLYYSKKIINGDKTGYITIRELNNKYLINFVYNYAKIEALVDKDDINDVVLNSSYILSTIKYNHNVIKIMLNEDYFTNKEEKYSAFESKEGSDSFTLQYDEEETVE